MVTGKPLLILMIQRRMHPVTCSLINDWLYKGRLHSSASPKQAVLHLAPASDKLVVLVKTIGEVEQTESGSRKNKWNAERVVTLATTLVQASLVEKTSVGIITPYRAQVSLIKQLLTTARLQPQERERIKVGTIHAFQGDESEVVICDLVESNANVGQLFKGQTGERLMNVAISRARTKLIFVGNVKVLADGIKDNHVGHKLNQYFSSYPDCVVQG